MFHISTIYEFHARAPPIGIYLLSPIVGSHSPSTSLSIYSSFYRFDFQVQFIFRIRFFFICLWPQRIVLITSTLDTLLSLSRSYNTATNIIRWRSSHSSTESDFFACFRLSEKCFFSSLLAAHFVMQIISQGFLLLFIIAESPFSIGYFPESFRKSENQLPNSKRTTPLVSPHRWPLPLLIGSPPCQLRIHVKLYFCSDVARGVANAI